MKNRTKKRLKNKNLHKKIKEMMENDVPAEELQKYLKKDDYESFEIFMDVSRELRLNDFFSDLNVDETELEKAKRTIVKINPKSPKWPLTSTLYRNHNGKYQVETLMNQYHDSVFRDGLLFGLSYGRKFIIEDLQNGRFTKQDILDMSKEEVLKYCDEDRKEI